MNPDDSSKIEKLKKSLYSRITPDIRSKRKFRFSSLISSTPTDWTHEVPQTEEVVLTKKYEDHTMSFLTKLLIGSILFFVLALGVGAYLVFNGSNLVSSDNIDITINGPVSVAGGDPFSFDIQVTNNNNVKLETVDVAVDFPAGTVDPDDTTKTITNFRELIPDIEPGGIGQKNMKVVLYGEENVKKEIRVLVEYRVKNSNAVFRKEKTFDVLISSSPLTLSVSSFKEINSGQDLEFAVTISSNSKEVIKNLILKSVYPFGFNFTSSDIKPLTDNATWKIGDIPPGGKRVIKIKGKLEGQDDELRVFRFAVGSASVKNDKVIGTEYIASTQDVTIRKPFISIKTELDGNEDIVEYATKFNDPVTVKITWFNNLDTTVLDGEIHVSLSGSAFDKGTVFPQDGVYKSATNEIVWNGVSTPSLSSIGAGESGTVTFTVAPRDLSSVQKLITNPFVNLDIGVRGNRNSENNVPERVTSSATRRIKVGSQLSFGAQVLRSSGAFENTGPIPPKVEQATTYTVVWTVDNTVNNVSAMEVHSKLPAQVVWVGKTFPTSEDINYNPVDGQIVWKAGNVGTYTSQNSKRRQVSFQVSLTPSISQVGDILDLVKEVTYTAHDDYTNETISGDFDSVSTRFSTDQTFKDGDEKVTQ